MFVGGITQQRVRQTADRGAGVRGIALRQSAQDQFGTTSRLARPMEGVPDTERWLVPAMVVGLLSVPALMYTGVEAGLSRQALLLVAAVSSLAEVVLLMRLVRPQMRARSANGDAVTEMHTLSTRAESAEATLRRDQDRFHELRSTVAGIGTTYRLLRTRKELIPAPTRNRLEDLCETELARLERLLVDASTGDTEVVDIDSVVEPLVDSLRVRGQRVAREGSRALALGHHDDTVEIVHILLENAARHAPGHPVTVRVRRSSSQVLVSVADQGPGVSADVTPQLFMRGVKAPDSPGQGIGLHIARRLAREMGGDLRLENDPHPSGATFTLSLPSADGAARRLATSR